MKWNCENRFRSTSLPRNFHHGCTGLVLISRVAVGTATPAAIAKLPSSSSSSTSSSCQSNYTSTTTTATSVGPLSLSSKCKCRWVCLVLVCCIIIIVAQCVCLFIGRMIHYYHYCWTLCVYLELIAYASVINSNQIGEQKTKQNSFATASLHFIADRHLHPPLFVYVLSFNPIHSCIVCCELFSFFEIHFAFHLIYFCSMTTSSSSSYSVHFRHILFPRNQIGLPCHRSVWAIAAFHYNFIILPASNIQISVPLTIKLN